MLEAVQSALEHDELDVAERTLAQWRGRTQLDASNARVHSAVSDGGRAPVAVGGRPDLAATRDAEHFITNFEQILAGRRVLAGVDLALELRRVPGESRVGVYLAGQSRLDEPVTLRPGPGNIEVVRISLDPRTGHELNEAETITLPGPLALALTAREAGELFLCDVDIVVPTGMVATRMRCRAALRGGTVVVAGAERPARAFDIAGAERTDLPGWLPTEAVEPAELARLAANLEAGQPAFCERAVRILPARRVEALELLRVPALERNPDQLVPLIPALRWLSGESQLGRDPRRWRTYLRDAPWRKP